MAERYGMGRGLVLALAAFSLLCVASAHATIIWDGDASKGTGIFGLIATDNCIGVGSSTLSAVSDATHGLVWRYNKPADSNRCENHGIRLDDGTKYVFADGSTYYLGWWSRISSTSNNNANFQWKSYGTGHQQNFPYVLKMVGGNMNLMYTPPGGGSYFIWNHSITANEWNHWVLRIAVSSSATTGSIDLWFNGTQQTFSTGGTRHFGRTFDTGLHNCPKWGVYGGSGAAMTNHVDQLRVGTTFADMGAPGGTSPTPTPTATPVPSATSTPTPTPVPGVTPTPTPTPVPGGTFSGYYRIMGQESGRALVVQSASTANSANVILYDYNDNATDNDEWQVLSIGSGYYRIIGRQSGKDMAILSASTANGAGVIQYTYSTGTTTNDEWQLADSGSGLYEIRNRLSGKNVQAMGTGNSSAVQQQADNNASNQRFQLVSIP